MGGLLPTESVDEILVVDNPDKSRYEARIGERILGIVEYELSAAGDRINLIHTEVLPDAEGLGVGSRLAKGSLENVRARGLGLDVECAFVTAYLARHRREYADLIRS
jgi:predicted GNAT family acetyltransferase